MASKVIQVDPVSRVSGLLSIEVEIDKGKVVNAKSSGMQIRGFKNMLQGRYPLDTIRLTARTCGICSCAHSVASAKALEMALGVTPDLNGSLLRDMALGFETLQNNIRQTYQFLMPDYVDITGISPLYKTNSKEINDYRLPKEINAKLASHYIEAIKYARSAHKLEAVIAGKAPHTHGVFVGGITTNYDINAYSVIKPLLLEIKNFVKDYMQDDLLTIASYYPEYLKWGEGKGNYLSYGFFTDLPAEFVVVKAGVKTKGNKEAVDTSQIRSSLAYTWLKAPGDTLKPLYEPPTLDYSKPGAYSWVDAPRYKGEAYEVGPLADLIVNDIYKQGTGTLHRVIARYIMTRKIIEKMERILEAAHFQKAYQEAWQVPNGGEGYALIGAPRGGLLHWLSIEDTKIKNYTLLPPSTWNMSPMDERNIHGAVEEALIGTPIENIELAGTIVGRIVRSFDPCLNCAAHIVSDKRAPFDLQIV